MIRDIINSIRYAYQRVRYGYDERIMWGFDDYLFDTIHKPLRKFCINALNDKEHMKYNPERWAIYSQTLQLLDKCMTTDKSIFDDYVTSHKFWSYFGRHIGYFWD